MKLAIVGSRNFNNYAAICEGINIIVDDYSEISEIVSGGAVGVDSLAALFAKDNAIPLIVFKPDWSTHGKAAGYLRNIEIVNYADFVLIFWDGVSKGTKHDIDLCIKHSKEHKLIMVDKYALTKN